MNDLAAMQISAAGANAQRTRLRVIAENLANIQTTGPNGPYQRKQTVFETVPFEAFAQELNSAIEEVLSPEEIAALNSVTVREVVTDGADPILRHDPSHPHADANGYVAYPNISIIREMTDMMEAQRSFEANLAASKASRDMINQVLDLLG